MTWDPGLGRYVITGYDDVVAVLQDPVTYSSAVAPPVPARDRDLLAGFAEWSARWLFFLDPPEHAARRVPVARALAPRAIAPLAEPIAATARDLAAALPPAFDALADFAHPLVARVVAGLLCAPGAATEEFLERARILEHAGANARDAGARRAGLEAIAGLSASSFSPAAPVPSALRAAWGPEDPDVAAHSGMLLFAGVETTQNLLANTLHALLDSGTWGAPVASAVEEGARFAPPVKGVLRRTTRPVELGGVPLPEGASLVAMTAAANRDPGYFSESARFDPYRSRNPHVSFGLGRQFCPGAELSRQTARAGLTALLDAFPRLVPAESDPPWRDHDPLIHAPRRLLVLTGG